ncbi:MAG: hypothetical protein AAGA66_09875 [Bacteroidota bacterium]
MQNKVAFVSKIFIFILFFNEPLCASPKVSFGKGAYDVDRLSNETLYYARALGLNHNVYIRINFTLKLSEENEATLDYRLMNDSIHQVVIYISKRISRSRQLLAIAHEMIHAQQYISKRLMKVNDKIFSWEGNNVKLSKVAYRERPWEEEAYYLSQILRRGYLRYSSLFVLDKKRRGKSSY